MRITEPRPCGGAIDQGRERCGWVGVGVRIRAQVRVRVGSNPNPNQRRSPRQQLARAHSARSSRTLRMLACSTSAGSCRRGGGGEWAPGGSEAGRPPGGSEEEVGRRRPSDQPPRGSRRWRTRAHRRATVRSSHSGQRALVISAPARPGGPWGGGEAKRWRARARSCRVWNNYCLWQPQCPRDGRDMR